MLSVLTPGKKKKSRKRKKETGPPWWPSGSVPACRCRGHRLSPPVGQYLPADAGDTGSLSGLESSHVLQRSSAWAPQARIPKPGFLGPLLHNEHGRWNGKPTHRDEDRKNELKITQKRNKSRKPWYHK